MFIIIDLGWFKGCVVCNLVVKVEFFCRYKFVYCLGVRGFDGVFCVCGCCSGCVCLVFKFIGVGFKLCGLVCFDFFSNKVMVGIWIIKVENGDIFIRVLF